MVQESSPPPLLEACRAQLQKHMACTSELNPEGSAFEVFGLNELQRDVGLRLHTPHLGTHGQCMLLADCNYLGVALSHRRLTA